MHHQTGGTDANYLQRNEDSTQFEDNGRWSVVRSKRQKMTRNLQQFKVPLLVNQFVMPLEKFLVAIETEGKTTITTRSAKEKSRRHRFLLIRDG
jgi:hypothetical protein